MSDSEVLGGYDFNVSFWISFWITYLIQLITLPSIQFFIYWQKMSFQRAGILSIVSLCLEQRWACKRTKPCPVRLLKNDSQLCSLRREIDIRLWGLQSLGYEPDPSSGALCSSAGFLNSAYPFTQQTWQYSTTLSFSFLGCSYLCLLRHCL